MQQPPSIRAIPMFRALAKLEASGLPVVRDPACRADVFVDSLVQRCGPAAGGGVGRVGAAGECD